MGRTVRALTVDRLADVVDPCRDCQFWERTPAQTWWSAGTSEHPKHPKRGWLTSALLEWGTPGRIVYVDDVPAGYITYAPAHLVPRALAFPTTPVSPDAVLLITARVAPQYAGQGLGRVLVQSAAKDLVRRRIRAMEAFATTRGRVESESLAGRADPSADVADPTNGQGGPESRRESAARSAKPRHSATASSPRPAPGSKQWPRESDPAVGAATPGTPDQTTAGPASDMSPAGAEQPTTPSRAGGADGCLLPVDFLTAVGFHTARDHPAYPRMRLDLRTVLRWRAEVEQAVERLFSPVRGIAVPPPVGTANRQ